MRTINDYVKLLEANPSADVGLSMAADIIYAARHGWIDRQTDHDTSEWRTLYARLKSQYGDDLSANQIQGELSSAGGARKKISND